MGWARGIENSDDVKIADLRNSQEISSTTYTLLGEVTSSAEIQTTFRWYVNFQQGTSVGTPV